jgi:hypothetical protein
MASSFFSSSPRPSSSLRLSLTTEDLVDDDVIELSPSDNAGVTEPSSSGLLSNPSSTDEKKDQRIRSSLVWDYVDVLEDGKVVCKRCPKSWPNQSTVVTSNLRDHLQRTHKQAFAELEKAEMEKAEGRKRAKAKGKGGPPSRQSKLTLPSQSTSTSAISPFFGPTREQRKALALYLLAITAEMNIPFRSLTDSTIFRDLMWKLIGWKVPSRFTILRLLPQYYKLCCAALRRKLSTVDTISITTDSTFLTKHEVPYIAITGHYITVDFKWEETVLAIFRADQSETGEYIARQLTSILQDLGLAKNRVHCVVTDEGKNFLNGVERLLDQEIIKESLRCSCHRFQLTFKHAITQAQDKFLLNLLDKCQRIVLTFKNGWASKKKDVFKECQEEQLADMRQKLLTLQGDESMNLLLQESEKELAEAQTDFDLSTAAENEAKAGLHLLVQEIEDLALDGEEKEFKRFHNQMDSDSDSDCDEYDPYQGSDEKEDEEEESTDEKSSSTLFSDIVQPLASDVLISDYTDLWELKKLIPFITRKRALIQRCATRWMTYLRMGEWVLIWKGALSKTIDKIWKDVKGKKSNISDYKLTNEEVAILKQFVTIGNFAKKVLRRCEGSKFPTISHLLHNHGLLVKYLTKTKDNTALYPVIRSFAAAAVTNAQIKFDPSVDKVAMIAAMLDPRYRNLSTIDLSTQGTLKSLLKEEWEKMRRELQPNSSLDDSRPNKRQRGS